MQKYHYVYIGLICSLAKNAHKFLLRSGWVNLSILLNSVIEFVLQISIAINKF